MKAPSMKLLVASLLLTLVVSGLVSLTIGPMNIPLSSMFSSPVLQLRLYRVLLAVIAGAGLSVSGVILQGLLRNPLAEPYILGISSGAGLSAVLVISSGVLASIPWFIPGAAFIGGLATVFLVFWLASATVKKSTPTSLLLSGVVVNSILGSAMMYIISSSPSGELHSVIWWLLGNLQLFNGDILVATLVPVVICFVIALRYSGHLDLIQLGDQPAQHLGLDIRRARVILLVLSSLMTGTIVAACGLIGFVGLIVPHSVRAVTGSTHKKLMYVSALGGSVFLVLSDLLARTLVSPREIPIGVITSLFGGIFFFTILRRRRRDSWFF